MPRSVRPSALRAPATTAPLAGSTTSPIALTATSAATVTPSMRSDALPMPPFIARPMPNSLPTLAPAPAPTDPSAGGSGARGHAGGVTGVGVRPDARSPTHRSNRIAAGTMGTRAGRPRRRCRARRASASRRPPRRGRTRCRRRAAPRAPARRRSAATAGRSRASRRRAAHVDAGHRARGHSTTVHPVGTARIVVWWPTLMPATSVIEPGAGFMSEGGGGDGAGPQYAARDPAQPLRRHQCGLQLARCPHPSPPP